MRVSGWGPGESGAWMCDLKFRGGIWSFRARDLGLHGWLCLRLLATIYIAVRSGMSGPPVPNPESKVQQPRL